eukprot:Tbor_TRINITY_DN5661_c0_g1::TRINITY_DN5661_c0_g1_i1::g.9074::m.9074
MLSVLSTQEGIKRNVTGKIVYSNETLLRLRTSPRVSTVPPDVSHLPPSCRNIIVVPPSTSIADSTHQDPSHATPFINAAVNVVRHEKKTKNGFTAARDNSPGCLSVLRCDKESTISSPPNQPIIKPDFISFSTRPDAGAHIATTALEREKLFSIRQIFTTRASAASRTISPVTNYSNGPRIQQKEPKSRTGESFESSVITQGTAALTDDNSTAAKSKHTCPWRKDDASTVPKSRDEDIFPSAPVPKITSKEGWRVASGTGEVNKPAVTSFYQEVPSAPISRSGNRQMGVQRQESSKGKSEEQKVSRRQKAKTFARDHSPTTSGVPRDLSKVGGFNVAETNAVVNRGTPKTTAVGAQGSLPSGNMYQMMSQSRDMTMDPTEWYQWWMGQVSDPGVTLVPVEVPVDEHGRVLDNGMNMNAALRSRVAHTDGYIRNSVVNMGGNGTPKIQASTGSLPKDNQATSLNAGADTCELDQKKSKSRGRRGGVKHRKKLERRNERGEGSIQAATVVIDTIESQECPTEDLVDAGKQNPNRNDVIHPEHCNPKPLEGDAFDRRVVQRERQVRLGKRTLGFRVVERLQERMEPVNPEAFPPKVTQHCSKRSWDGQMRRWRQILHTYDERAHEVLSRDEIAALPERSANAYEEDYTLFGDDADIRDANGSFGEYVKNIASQDFAYFA